MSWTRPPAWLLATLGVLGLVLALTILPGVFLVDECHYLVTVTGLCKGKLTVPGTEGLAANSELFYFDPVAKAKMSYDTPAASTVPGLYAFLALPFAKMGWRGLVLLNILSYLLCALLVFHYAARHAARKSTPYLATFTFLFGTYCLEYTQGMWPHMVSMTLCMAGLVLSSHARAGEMRGGAYLSGLSFGLATGVRYQNILLAGFCGLGVLLWAPQALPAGLSYGLGVLGPLAASSVINRLRNGWWNPVSKGPYYLTSLARQGVFTPIRDLPWVLWAKVVDFVAHPPVQFMKRQKVSGAYLLHATIKKAWLQSCPWILVSLVSLGQSWARRREWGLAGPGQEQRVMAMMVGSVLLLFALAGFRRTDGFCFNQRYFIDFLPMMAVVLAWAAERTRLLPWALAAGLLLGANAALAMYLLPPVQPARHIGLSYLPLLLAGLLLISWQLSQRARRKWIFPLLLGACLSWSLVVHLLDDVQGSRKVRDRKGWVARQVGVALPKDQPSAVMAHFPLVVDLCALTLTHDLVLADTNLDHGARGPETVDELLKVGRRVFLVMDHFYPESLKARMLKGRKVRVANQNQTLHVYEILK